jgi:iron complex outermembrane receptor protein
MNGKFYFFPNAGSEILAEVDWYDSEYGVPPATEYSKPRYWRFSDWNRIIASLGGTFALGGSGHLKVKGFYTRHYNVLDAYTKANLQTLQWVSTYNNETYGVNLSGAVAPSDAHDLRFSVSFRDDIVSQQADKGDPWEEYNHKIVSAGVEDHYQIADEWRLVGGFSVDHLRKDFGDNDTSVNPIAGIQFEPGEAWDFHLTIAQKSRFPSMKALYSTSGGNPDLRDERATNTEFGASWTDAATIRGAVFYNRIKDLIESVRMPDGYKMNVNVGNASITGFEVETTIPWSIFDVSVNYTFLDGQNLDTDEDLDLTPHHQFNAMLRATFGGGWSAAAWGLAVSRSTVHYTNLVAPVPGYCVINAEVTKQLKSFQVFARVENLLDQAYATESGFPMPARSFQAGLRLDVAFNR